MTVVRSVPGRALVVAAALLLPALARAQAPSPAVDREVMAVIVTLFDGMRQTDSAKARSVLHPNTLLVSAGEKPNNGGPVVTVDPVDGWLKSIGTPHKETYDERIRNPVIQVDGNLATVWVEYSFYVGTRLNHCGVDAFQLAKGSDGWKIVAIADTRRRTGCNEIPPG
ncbi:MAG: nuclear transport factor 2 family protein [Gemmatimonadetes bacterium]|nr:nuclear transport factor 2 family protein [Gemmatimonadota bacterium]